MTDVIETLARALWDAGDEMGTIEGYYPIAAALLAQIAPTLRAEGMEMAANVAERDFILTDSEYRDGLRWSQNVGHFVAKNIRAEAKRLREGGEG